jgi:four helix bundle protein
MIRNYQKIIAWKLAHELTLEIYNLTRRFPTQERYGITSQVRRAATGVPSNIAEGSGRESKRDYLRFLFIAHASLKETEYFLLLDRDLQLLGGDEYNGVSELVNRSFATLQGLIKAVKKETGIMGRMLALVSSSIAIYAVQRYTA